MTPSFCRNTMNEYAFRFSAPLVKTNTGKPSLTVAYVPDSTVERLEFGPSKRLRIDGEINGIRFEGALMPSRGRWFLMVSKQLQKQCGLGPGEKIEVSFDVADQDAVTVPVELQHALEANDKAMEVWTGWTAGKRRGHCHQIAKAKTVGTRERRVHELIDYLREES
ncbi:MAG: YdeI/OmpD-associated family protein [Planctomycetota bacterium]